MPVPNFQLTALEVGSGGVASSDARAGDPLIQIKAAVRPPT